VGHEHRASDLLHGERQEITKAPAIGFDAAGGRLLLDPEKGHEFLKERGQTHGLSPFVRHALGRIIRRNQPGVNRRAGPLGGVVGAGHQILRLAITRASSQRWK
jgi:hypothetical protein